VVTILIDVDYQY